MFHPRALARFLEENGFSGVCVDRLGHPDDGLFMADAIERTHAQRNIVGGDGNLLLFRVITNGVSTADYSVLTGAERAGSFPESEVGTVPIRSRGSPRRNRPPFLWNGIVVVPDWVGNPKFRSAPHGAEMFLISSNAAFWAIGHIGLPRIEAAAGTKAAELGQSGFIVLLQGDAIPAGSNAVSMGFSDRKGAAMCCTGIVVNFDRWR